MKYFAENANHTTDHGAKRPTCSTHHHIPKKSTDFGRMMAKILFLCSPNLHPNPKCMYSFIMSQKLFCRNNGLLMENHGLRTHNNKVCAESSTGNTQNIPLFFRPICPNRPLIWDIVKKPPSYVHA